MNTFSDKRLLLSASGLSLLAGGTIYIMARPRNLLLFWIADKGGLGTLLDILRSSCPMAKCPEWLVYSLPGGLWALSYILITDMLAYRLSVLPKVLLAGVIPMVGLLSELLQWMGWMPGTFDMTDILFYISPYLLYILYNLLKMRK